MGSKSTDAEMERRVTDVYNLLLVGTSRGGIVQYAARNWLVEPRIVDTYIRRAKGQIRKYAAIQRDEAMGTARARLELLFQKALAANDLRGALAVQREINALADLYPPPPLSLKALLAEGGAPTDPAFWSALFGEFRALGVEPRDILEALAAEVKAQAAEKKPDEWTNGKHE
jgi:hypothetical protein